MLTNADRSWLQGELNRIHDKMDALAQVYADEKAAHLREHHNIYKQVGLISAIFVGLAAAMEVGKWIIHR